MYVVYVALCLCAVAFTSGAEAAAAASSCATFTGARSAAPLAALAPTATPVAPQPDAFEHRSFVEAAVMVKVNTSSQGAGGNASAFFPPGQLGAYARSAALALGLPSAAVRVGSVAPRYAVTVGGSREALLGWAVTLHISVVLAGAARGVAGKELLGSLRESLVGARAQLFASVPDSVAGVAGYTSAGALAAAVVADPLAPAPVVVPGGGTIGDVALLEDPGIRAALGVGSAATASLLLVGGIVYLRQRRAAEAQRMAVFARLQAGGVVDTPVGGAGTRQGRR